MMTSPLSHAPPLPTSATTPPGGVTGVPRSAPPLPPITPAGAPAGLPTPGTAPGTRPPGTLVEDLTEASRLLEKGVELIGRLPKDDVGLDSTKDLRIRVYKTNLVAQGRLEGHLTTNQQPDVLSTLRRADASLEDANWQLAKKPSPDGRFNGVDVPGALRDTAEGARLVNDLLTKLTHGGGGTQPPTNPPLPPTAPPPTAPTVPPTTPPPSPRPTPPTVPPTTPPPSPRPTPPTAPPTAPPTTQPGTGGGDGEYPGEGEFPPEKPEGY